MFFFWLLGVTKFQRKNNEVFGQNWAVSVHSAITGRYDLIVTVVQSKFYSIVNGKCALRIF